MGTIKHKESRDNTGWYGCANSLNGQVGISRLPLGLWGSNLKWAQPISYLVKQIQTLWAGKQWIQSLSTTEGQRVKSMDVKGPSHLSCPKTERWGTSNEKAGSLVARSGSHPYRACIRTKSSATEILWEPWQRQDDCPLKVNDYCSLVDSFPKIKAMQTRMDGKQEKEQSSCDESVTGLPQRIRPKILMIYVLHLYSILYNFIKMTHLTKSDQLQCIPRMKIKKKIMWIFPSKTKLTKV